MMPSNDGNSLSPISSVKYAANLYNSYLNCNQFWCAFKKSVCATLAMFHVLTTSSITETGSYNNYCREPDCTPHGSNSCLGVCPEPRTLARDVRLWQLLTLTLPLYDYHTPLGEQPEF